MLRFNWKEFIIFLVIVVLLAGIVFYVYSKKSSNYSPGDGKQIESGDSSLLSILDHSTDGNGSGKNVSIYRPKKEIP